MFKNKFIIVDDFYSDPDRVRAEVFKKGFNKESTGNYAGVMSKEPIILKEHEIAFNNILNEQVVPSGSPFTGFFRATKKDDKFYQHIHYDPGFTTSWVGIIYMSKPEDYTLQNGNVLDAGTSFWKHKELGIEEAPFTEEQAIKLGWGDKNDAVKFLETDGLDESKWIRTLTIPFKYNRLVLIRPWLFHSPGVAFGDTLENSRLIQLFFLGNKP